MLALNYFCLQSLGTNQTHRIVQDDLTQLAQNQSHISPVVNGTITTGINLIQQNRPVQNTSVPILVSFIIIKYVKWVQ